jgi:phospholipid N-methyltransferase
LRRFVLAAVRNPQRVGAVYPSSARLAAELASVVPTVGAPVVVELGAGTGAVSSAISARAPCGARHLALELDGGMAAFLSRKHPSIEVLNADACDLSAVLAAREIGGVAAVVSGLPWSLFNPVMQEHILHQIVEAIGTEGVFTTFAYAHASPLPSARNFRRALAQTFDEVEVSRLVWRNMPPAFTYVCRQRHEG